MEIKLLLLISLSPLQLLPGKEHAVVLPANNEAEVWQLRVCSAAADTQYPL